MPCINEAMLRRRAEHNEGMLHNLEEISLHQQEIEHIECIDRLCPHLRILLLQNNQIQRIHGLRRLKELEYLNLALNNIEIIQGLESCEALKKLDLTVNFIDAGAGLLSIERLRGNLALRELYVTGNPCQDFAQYRSFVIATLPQIERLDGEKVRPSERIQAQQELGEARKAVVCTANGELPPEEQLQSDAEYSAEDRYREFVQSVEERQQKEEEDAQRRKDSPFYQEKAKKPRREKLEEWDEDARHYQKNEGGWEWSLVGDDNFCPELELKLSTGKYMDTSLMEVDVRPTWVQNDGYVRVLIKGKLFQLQLPEEVSASSSSARRSTTTGELVIVMPKVTTKRSIRDGKPYRELPILRPVANNTKGRNRAGDLMSKREIQSRDISRNGYLNTSENDLEDAPPLVQ